MSGNNAENSSASHHPEPSAYSYCSYYPDLSKLRSSLFNFTAISNQSCEAVTNPVREFIRPYQREGSVYRWYGVADAINLSFSLCSLFYFLKHAYQGVDGLLSTEEFQMTVQEFHSAEKTPEGLACAVVFTVFLVGFSTLGSFYDAKKDEGWVKYLVDAWPCFRTAAKQLKWWDKGWWAFLSLLVQYRIADQAFWVNRMYALATFGGLLSAMNAVALRLERDRRKTMVTNNLDLIEGIRSHLHQLEKMPSELVGFENSLIWLRETKDGEERHSLCYVNEVGSGYEEIELNETELTDFCAQVEALQTKNVHNRMKQYLTYLVRISSSSEQATAPTCDSLKLHFISDEAELNDDKIKSLLPHSYIYFSQETGLQNESRLYYVDGQGHLIEDSEKSAKFHAKYQEVQKNRNILNLSEVQLQSIQGLKIKPRAPQTFAESYKQFIEQRARILGTEAEPGKVQDQSIWIKRLMPIAAGISSIGDGLYFYFFVARAVLNLLSPTLAIWMLDSSAALFTICMMTRIEQEFDFQRRLEMTVLRTETELSKKDFIYLHEQLEQLLDDKNAPVPSDLHEIAEIIQASQSARDRQLKRYRIDVRDRVTKQESKTESEQKADIVRMLLHELTEELKLNKHLQDKLRANLDRSLWAAALEGLQNGLAVQGAIASFSFMVSSLCYISAATCPPAFMFGCLVLGMTAITVSLLQAVISYYFYCEKVKETQKELREEFPEEILQKMMSNDAPDRKALKQALDYLNDQPLDPAVDFVIIEWSEVFRLLFKGAVKGRNAVLEIFARFLEGSDNTWMLPYLVVAGASVFSAALGMRAAAKGFAVGRPDSSLSAGKAQKGARTFFEEDERDKKSGHVFDPKTTAEISSVDDMHDPDARLPVDWPDNDLRRSYSRSFMPYYS